MNFDDILKIALLATVTALAAEDLDRRIEAAEAQLAAEHSAEALARADLLGYSRRVVEERDRILELSVANEPERDEATLQRLREVRERRLGELTERQRAVTSR